MSDRIFRTPGVRSGQPAVRGIRITAGDVLGFLAAGMTFDEIVDDYPELSREDIVAVLEWAQRLILASTAAYDAATESGDDRSPFASISALGRALGSEPQDGDDHDRPEDDIASDFDGTSELGDRPATMDDRAWDILKWSTNEALSRHNARYLVELISTLRETVEQERQGMARLQAVGGRVLLAFGGHWDDRAHALAELREVVGDPLVARSIETARRAAFVRMFLVHLRREELLPAEEIDQISELFDAWHEAIS